MPDVNANFLESIIAHIKVYNCAGLYIFISLGIIELIVVSLKMLFCSCIR